MTPFHEPATAWAPCASGCCRAQSDSVIVTATIATERHLFRTVL